MRARIALVLGATVCLLAAAEGPGALAGRVQSVTLSLVRFYSNACNCYQARLSGQIASNAAGEEIVVFRQYCGRPFAQASAVAQATTRPGGFWEAELQIVSRPEAPVSESYRARWNGRLSAPVTFVGRLAVSRARLGPTRSRVSVFTTANNPVDLKGRRIVLQRRVGGAWRRTASARLSPHRVKYYTFVATFTLPRRGWTVRALVPATSAAPCFRASVSEEWRS